MATLLEALLHASAVDRDSYRPLFFRLREPTDRAALEDLLKHEPRIQVFDELHSQLSELVRTLNPSIVYTKEARDAAAQAHLKDVPAEEYGVWVYYPWSFRLVHLLDEPEFVLVRTDRNRNKITAAEQAVLATKRIGVIGLSVGQSVCLTLALERSFGELRIADFDVLELSNLNRIRSGTQSMGHLKTVNVAREIAEIDPFLKVTLFNEGLDRDNIERFCTEGGKLDILVDECDSVDVKIFCRQKAKALRIPVLMDTSDRGLIDVERFDQEPGRSILHGLVDHLDLDLAAKARTNEEKLPFVIPIIGLDTMSTRMKASMLEIESSVTTWPQLGSAVIMGGAIIGHAARRILLGQEMTSGRWWLDPDDMFGVTAEHTQLSSAEATVNVTVQPTLDLDGMIHAADRVDRVEGEQDVSADDAELLARAGCMAPSGGNSQPWRFLHHEGRLFVFLDGERARSALDPGLRYAEFGMGACVENMLLQGASRGLVLTQMHRPLPDVPQLVAVLAMRNAGVRLDPYTSVLADRIGVRCTNRKHSDGSPLTDAEAKALGAALMEDGAASVAFVHDKATIERIAVLCGAAERIRFLNPTCHKDMFTHEMRWTAAEAKSTRDGIDLDTLELSATDRTGLRVAADRPAVSLLREWKAGHVMDKLTGKTIRASIGLVVLSLPDLSLSSAYVGGRALQRLWLKASAMGISAQPVSAPIFMGIHGLWDDQGILYPEEHREAGAVLDEFKSVMGSSGMEPFFILRLGRAGEPSARSLRLPLSSVFHSTARIPA